MAERVVVGMSGGVDSAVAALLLKQQGYEVLGLFMRNWEDDEDCPARQDFLDVLAVADILGIEVEAVNFAAEYRDRVFSVFLREYAAGRTPNPDVLCNSEIKFAAFLDHAMALGGQWIATGHYARLRRQNGETQLCKADDGGKDQSYFLYRLNQNQLRPALFPLGNMPKPQVRALAASAGLPNHAKKDSTGICFIGERPFREFLARYLKSDPGPMLDEHGCEVGRHIGLHHYTLGQRQGLGLGGPGEPWFVAEKRLEDNTLVVVRGHAHPLLYRQTLTAGDLSWISGRPPQSGWVLAAKTRYRQADTPCVVEAIDANVMKLRFALPQFAITPGQSMVLYEGSVCLGGGIILGA